MKRKLLTTAFILLLGVPLHLEAQVFFSNPWVHAGTNALVRQQNIVYYEDGTGVGYFAYFPLSAPVHSVRVHPEWSIKDFQVVDTIAYFCGTNTHTHTQPCLVISASPGCALVWGMSLFTMTIR